ncbi:MAG: hypothetical protein HQ453_08520 [Actinobacteria bacterium]|nr:hypothetical protein [Actinomycetota bacterium]
MSRIKLAGAVAVTVVAAAALAGCGSTNDASRQASAGPVAGCPASPDYGVAPEYTIELETAGAQVLVEQCAIVNITIGAAAERLAGSALPDSKLFKPLGPTSIETVSTYAIGAPGSIGKAVLVSQDFPAPGKTVNIKIVAP